MTEDEWASVLGVQLTGVFRTCQTFARRTDEGSLINVTSRSPVVTMADLLAYSTAKGAIDAFTRNAAKELAPEIRVNAIRLGHVATRQTADAHAEGSYRYERIRERAPKGWMAELGEIAGTAVYLASDAASYTTGEILTVDGGFAASAFE